MQQTAIEFQTQDPNSKTKRVMELALGAGMLQLGNGAEVWRVDDTINHICSAYGLENVDSFVLCHAISLSANDAKECVFSSVKHVPFSGVHLEIVSEVNSLSRKISAGMLSVADAEKELERIRKIQPISQWIRILAAGIGAGCFAYILGANILESIFSIIIGILVYVLSSYMEEKKFYKLPRNMIGGAFISVMAIVITRIPFFSHLNIDKMIVGGIMPLIPGVAFVNSIRDMANEDLISGTIRMIDTIMVFLYIAIGANTILAFYYNMIGGLL